MKKILFLIFAISFANFNAQEHINNTSDFSTDSDREQLIYAILNIAVVQEKSIPDYEYITNKYNIFISNLYHIKFSRTSKHETSLIDKSEIPNQINDVNFTIKSESEMQTIADNTDDFLYLTIGNIEISGNSAKIGLTNNWIISKKNKNKYGILSGGGYILTFKKINGKWIFDKNAITTTWIS